MVAKRSLTMRPLPFLTLSTTVNMQFVDAAPGYTAQRRKRPRVCIEQHLVTLDPVGHQPERPRGAQQHAQDLRAVVDAAHHKTFLALVELVRSAQLEDQRDEGIDRSPLALTVAPCSNEAGYTGVATAVSGRLDLGVQRLGRAPLVFGPPGVGLQYLLEHLVEYGELVGLLAAPVPRRPINLTVQSLRNRVARQPRDARDLALGLLLPAMQTPNPANHVHGEHCLSPGAQNEAG